MSNHADTFIQIAKRAKQDLQDFKRPEALSVHCLELKRQAGAALRRAYDDGCFPLSWEDRSGKPIRRHMKCFDRADVRPNMAHTWVWEMILGEWLSVDYPEHVRSSVGFPHPLRFIDMNKLQKCKVDTFTEDEHGRTIHYDHIPAGDPLANLDDLRTPESRVDNYRLDQSRQIGVSAQAWRKHFARHMCGFFIINRLRAFGGRL